MSLYCSFLLIFRLPIGGWWGWWGYLTVLIAGEEWELVVASLIEMIGEGEYTTTHDIPRNANQRKVDLEFIGNYCLPKRKEFLSGKCLCCVFVFVRGDSNRFVRYFMDKINKVTLNTNPETDLRLRGGSG